MAAPKVAVAGFNPHNGDGGTCGREEIDIIAPAVRALQARDWPTPDPFHGPFPADTIFLKAQAGEYQADRKSTRLNSSHLVISYAVFCLKKKKKHINLPSIHPRASRHVSSL